MISTRNAYLQKNSVFLHTVHSRSSSRYIYIYRRQHPLLKSKKNNISISFVEHVSYTDLTGAYGKFFWLKNQPFQYITCSSLLAI